MCNIFALFIQDTPAAEKSRSWLKAGAIKGVGRRYTRKRLHQSMSRKMEGYKMGGGRERVKGRERQRGKRRIPGYRCRHTGARGCNALLMNTKNFIKDCLYIKLSTKLCPITPVAPSRAWKLLAAAAELLFPPPYVPLTIYQASKNLQSL